MRTLAILAAFAFLQVLPLLGQESSPPGSGNLRQLLQQGLFEEEATRDISKAAAAYAAIISEYETQRTFAATALFRLAEIRARQGNKAEAIALHQRLLAEFSSSEELGKLSRERLAALGGSPPATAAEVEAPTDAERKELVQLREMVKNSPDLINSEENGQTPLVQATRKGWLVAAAFLLDHGADVNQLTPASNRGPGDFPLKAAAGLGHKGMVELLLARGADVNRKDQYGRTALYEACEQGRIEVTRTLLAHGADSNIVVSIRVNEQLGTPLHVAVSAENLPLVRLLLDHKANPNLLNSKGDSALIPAVMRRNEAMIKELLARGADVNVSANKNGTVLHQSVGLYGRSGIVSLFLEHGASVSALAEGGNPNCAQRTPLHFATNLLHPLQSVPGGEPKESDMLKGEDLEQRYKIWEALLGKGADINARDACGSTPLHLAAMQWNLPADAIVWLIKRGADIDAKDKDGRTPLDVMNGVNRRIEVDRQLSFQKWSKRDAIKLLIYGNAYASFQQSISFDRSAESPEPPPVCAMLIKALEDWKGGGERPEGVKDVQAILVNVTQEILVYRAQESGEFQEHARIPLVLLVTDLDSVSFPAFQWGDIVVMKAVWSPQVSPIPKAPLLQWLRRCGSSSPEGKAKQD